MTLSRTRIVDAAGQLLCRHGLAGLSMRRLAQDLGVQPGALYYHVDSKQDLLVAVAGRVLDESVGASATDPAEVAVAIREALLPVRDGADVVSFANSFRPETLAPIRRLEHLTGTRLPQPEARWAARTLTHYVLGFVAEEQNRDELVRAGIVERPDGEEESDDAFRFGVGAILRGLATVSGAVVADGMSHGARARWPAGDHLPGEVVGRAADQALRDDPGSPGGQTRDDA